MMEVVVLIAYAAIVGLSVQGILWLFGIGTTERWETWEQYQAKKFRWGKKNARSNS